MVWELHGFLGVETCGETISVLGLASVGLLSAVACGGSFFVASRYYLNVPVYISEDDGRDDKEKAACGRQTCEI